MNPAFFKGKKCVDGKECKYVYIDVHKIDRRALPMTAA